jgi:hypothetical protein
MIALSKDHQGSKVGSQIAPTTVYLHFKNSKVIVIGCLLKNYPLEQMTHIVEEVIFNLTRQT